MIRCRDLGLFAMYFSAKIILLPIPGAGFILSQFIPIWALLLTYRRVASLIVIDAGISAIGFILNPMQVLPLLSVVIFPFEVFAIWIFKKLSNPHIFLALSLYQSVGIVIPGSVLYSILSFSLFSTLLRYSLSVYVVVIGIGSIISATMIVLPISFVLHRPLLKAIITRIPARIIT